MSRRGSIEPSEKSAAAAPVGPAPAKQRATNEEEKASQGGKRSRATPEPGPARGLRFSFAPDLTAEEAAAVLCGAAQFVAAFAVVHSFRLPRVVRMSTRFVHDPLAAALAGIVAGGATALLVRVAVRSKNVALGTAMCVVGCAIAGVATGFLSVTVISWLRGGLELGYAIVGTKKTIYGGLYMVPPGVFWGVGAAAVAAFTNRALRGGSHDALERAVWAGGFVLLGCSEAALLLFGEGVLPTLVGVAGVVGGVVAVAFGTVGLAAQARSRGASGSRESATSAGLAGSLAARTMVALALVELWVGALWWYWRG